MVLQCGNVEHRHPFTPVPAKWFNQTLLHSIGSVRCQSLYPLGPLGRDSLFIREPILSGLSRSPSQPCESINGKSLRHVNSPLSSK